MRTTVTLDQDVVRMLRDAMHRSQISFKQAINAAVRTGLSRKTTRSAPAPFVVRTRPLGLRPGLDPAGFNQLPDDLEIEALVEKARRRRLA